MTGGEILGLVALVVLVGAGAVLAAAETSLTHMRRPGSGAGPWRQRDR